MAMPYLVVAELVEKVNSQRISCLDDRMYPTEFFLLSQGVFVTLQGGHCVTGRGLPATAGRKAGHFVRWISSLGIASSSGTVVHSYKRE